MAVAAFKSSSRRGNQSSTSSSSSSSRPSREEPRNKAPIRRSRSVSAFSRGKLDISTEFLNKRDNPLFRSTASPLDCDDETCSTKTLLETSKFNESTPTSDPRAPRLANSNSGFGTRGRSATRIGETGSVTGRKEAGRSLSRVETGRRTRSASQCPVLTRHRNYSTSESEAESKDGKDLGLVGSNRKGVLFGSENDVLDQVKDLCTWSSQHSSVEASDCFAATSSVQVELPEAGDIYETVRSEVRRAISEIQNDLESAIQRSHAAAIAVANVANIPPDLVNPGAVELVLEIRREYAKKLEESHERARNLRAELAVEEHRGQELDRILKEVLPYPKTPNVQKSRPARKASIERRRMSKRLAEDAKAYFDECVSLSTFDSSDFSSQDDPPLNLVGPPTPSAGYGWGILGQSMNIHCDISQPPGSIETLGAIHGQVSSITGSAETGCKPCFSFAQEPSETSGLKQDIQQYIKKFEKKVFKLPRKKSNFCDLREYIYQSSAESLLIDRVLLKSRIESGGLLLCGGGDVL